METPRLPSFFKITKNRRFKYNPLYYNPQKEDLEQRISAIKKQLDSEGKAGDQIAAFKVELNERWGRTSRRKIERKSSIRIIFLVGVLTLLAYYFLMK